MTNPKARGLQRNVTISHACRWSASYHAASSCRSFNWQGPPSHFLASDQRCVSADPCRLANTFGSTLEVWNVVIICAAFLSEPWEHLHNFPRWLIGTKYHVEQLLKMWSSFCCTCAPQNLMMQCYIHYLTKTKIPREKSWEEGCHNRVLHIYHGPLHTLVAVIVNLLFAIFMFLEPYELPGGPEKFESVSVLLYIIIWQV